MTRAAQPPGANSRTWFGNRDGDEWVHASGVMAEGGQRGVDLGIDPEEPPVDVVEDDDEVPGSDDLPADIREDDLSPHEPPAAEVPSTDSDIDEPVAGEPDEGDIPEA